MLGFRELEWHRKLPLGYMTYEDVVLPYWLLPNTHEALSFSDVKKGQRGVPERTLGPAAQEQRTITRK